MNFKPTSEMGPEGILEQEMADMRQSVLIGYRKNANVSYKDFRLKLMLGRGTFGKVYLAELVTQMNKLYAIKAIRKDVLIEYN
jgi:serine/threonine protein kinase